ncbi:unnamed protein product [marine sediment metagenome]|uniref:GAD domain-containing protein n=1 Tax=marine sediment metagenome TaxID=412755 RepID=X1KG98_9ZZZZ
MKLKNISDIARQSTFKVFTSVLEKGWIVKGLCAPSGEKYSRSDIEKTLTEFVGDYGAKGLTWFKVKKENDKLTLAHPDIGQKKCKSEYKDHRRSKGQPTLFS